MKIDRQNFLFSLLDFVPLGICVVNENFDILSWNHTLSVWTVKDASEMEGKNLLKVYPHLDKPMFVERFNHVFEGAPPAFFSSKIHKYLIPCSLDDGVYRNQHCTFSRVPIRDDRLNKMAMLSIQDVTDLNESISKLKSTMKVKEEFFGLCSHDLKSPLNAIIGLSDLMMTEECEVSEMQEYARIINESGTMMLDLISNLLDLTKQGKLGTKQFEKINIKDALESSVKVHKFLADKKSIKLITNIENDVEMMGRRKELVRIFNNLLSNAIKFTNENGEVSARVWQEGDFAKISIKDNGIGISDDKLNHLFEKYTKEQRTGTAGEAGTGLGLAITKGFVDSFNGKLSVDSVLAKGTEFIISFPLA